MIEVSDLCVELSGQRVVDELSLSVVGGEVLALLGPNGSGKSSVLRAISGELSASSGAIRFGGRASAQWDTRERARCRAVLSQSSQLNFAFTAQEVVLLGRIPHRTATTTARDAAIAEAALDAVGCRDLARRLYPTLSGGERQRVQLARVLAQVWEASGMPRLLLLDEPTNHLDLSHQHRALSAIRAMAATGVGVIVVLHDLSLAARYSHRAIVLARGRSVAAGNTADVLAQPAVAATFGVAIFVGAHPVTHEPLVVCSPEPDALRQHTRQLHDQIRTPR